MMKQHETTTYPIESHGITWCHMVSHPKVVTEWHLRRGTTGTLRSLVTICDWMRAQVRNMVRNMIPFKLKDWFCMVLVSQRSPTVSKSISAIPRSKSHLCCFCTKEDLKQDLNPWRWINNCGTHKN